jgi:hypothetical protein
MSGMGFTRKHYLYGALTFVSLIAAFAKVTYFAEPGRRALEFYLGVMYITFIAWDIGQLRAISAREQNDADKLPEGDDLFQSPEVRPTEDAMISAETYLSVGENIDTVCRFVEPRYSDWTPAERQRYRQALKAAIEDRRVNTDAAQEGPSERVP